MKSALIITALIIVFGFFAVKEGQTADKNDCLKWQKEATEYQGYYLTKNQKAQCDYYSVEINAPVK